MILQVPLDVNVMEIIVYANPFLQKMLSEQLLSKL